MKKMQGGRGRGNPFFSFGDPFAGFEGMPSLFGGRDPFDDPFFRRPFGGIFPSVPGGSPFMDMNPLGSSLFGPRPNPFMDEHAYRIHESRSSLPNNSKGPIIEELTSDDENEQPDSENSQQENSGKQPYVEHPDDEFEGKVCFTNCPSKFFYYINSKLHNWFISIAQNYGISSSPIPIADSP